MRDWTPQRRADSVAWLRSAPPSRSAPTPPGSAAEPAAWAEASRRSVTALSRSTSVRSASTSAASGSCTASCPPANPPAVAARSRTQTVGRRTQGSRRAPMKPPVGECRPPRDFRCSPFPRRCLTAKAAKAGASESTGVASPARAGNARCGGRLGTGGRAPNPSPSACRRARARCLAILARVPSRRSASDVRRANLRSGPCRHAALTLRFTTARAEAPATPVAPCWPCAQRNATLEPPRMKPGPPDREELRAG